VFLQTLSMRAFSHPAQFYIWTLAATAAVCLFLTLVLFPATSSSYLSFFVFSLLAILAGLFPVAMPRRFIEITATTAVNIAAVLLFPFSLAILIAAIGAAATELRQHRIWYKRMFNISKHITTYAVLYITFHLFSSGHAVLLSGWREALVLVLVGITYYFLDTSLVILVVSLTGRVPFLYIWQTNLRNIMWHQISMICAGFLLAFLWTLQPWSSVLIVLPLVILRQAFSLTALLETQTHEAIKALVDTIDARDASTYQHSERVAAYARAIAEAMGLTRAEIEGVTISARLHDLGKVGISDAWLHKVGPLTDEERDQFQRHPVLGAEIVARFPVLGVEYGMVRSHHERWDGCGYPDRLSGRDIPVGARIITVADAFDAMTSDRPYRKALSYAEARRRLHAGIGTQFDPRVVAAALSVLPTGVESTPAVPTNNSELLPATKGELISVAIPFSENRA